MGPGFPQPTLRSFCVATYFSRILSEDLQEVICSVFTRWIINSHTQFAKPIKKGMLWIIPPTSQQQFSCSHFREEQEASQNRLENLRCGHVNNKTIKVFCSFFLKSNQVGNKNPLLKITYTDKIFRETVTE